MSFGEYFRELRKKKNKKQKDIADCIGKTTMLVSGVENGKNGPFNTEDLLKISQYLNLNESEEEDLLIEAAIERGSIPDNLMEYMRQFRKTYILLSTLRKNKYDDKDILELVNKLEEKKDAKND